MSELLRVEAPALVRKLGRKRYWGAPDQPEGERVAEIVRNVFLNDTPPYSLYRVGADRDLQRISLALNAGRKVGSLTEDSFFVAFLPAELEAVGIEAKPTLGDTPCIHANQLHHDAEASEDQLRELIVQAVRAGRQVAPLNKSAMKRVVETATAEQCKAALPDAPECKADSCRPAN